MTFEGYINERFEDAYDKPYVLHEHRHPEYYVLEDKVNEQEYALTVKSTGDNLFYYADEIINQGVKQYIYYKPGYSHYCIRNTKTGEEWEIPKKETCVRICEELNNLAFENKFRNFMGKAAQKMTRSDWRDIE